MLKDRFEHDTASCFMNGEHFADEHTWNGVPFKCVCDEEASARKKNAGFTNDVPFLPAEHTVIVYVPVADFPGRAVANEMAFFDGRNVQIMQVTEDVGMLSLLLNTYTPRAL